MKKQFEDLRTKTKKMLSDEDLNGAYGFALCRTVPWFAALKFDSISENIKNCSDVQVVSTAINEKEKVIESLQDYVGKEIAKNEKKSGLQEPSSKTILRSSGAELHISKDKKKETETKAINIDSVSSLADFYSDLKKCTSCVDKINGPIITSCEQELESLDVLFVGDSPRETEQGKYEVFAENPYALLLKMIKAMEIPEKRFRVTTAQKCICKSSSEKTCLTHLYKEIALWRPKVVISLGAIATNCLLGGREKLSKIHGKFIHQKLELSSDELFEYQLVPIFHPELLIINPSMKITAWKDLQKIIEFINKT